MKRLISSAILTAMLCGCSSTPLPEKLPEEKIRLAAIKKYIAQQGKVESIEKVKVNNVDLLLIRYVLNPTPHSYIRCGVALPMVEVWSGRFIGIGNTGYPENYPGNVSDVAEMLRIATTGLANTPDLWTIMQILGKERTIARLDAAIAAL